MMQMVILAGGLATRLRPLTETIPKSLVTINGKPFLQYQVELLRRHGIIDIVLCIGYLGDKIRDYFGDGRRFGVQLRYSEEKEHLLGTAGAVKNAEGLLQDQFFLMYGDSYLIMDYAEIEAHFNKFGNLGLMVVYKNFDRYVKSNVVVEGNLVKAYDKRRRKPGMVYVNHGLSILRKEALALIPPGEPYSQEQLYQELILRRELLAFKTQQRFYEVGSPAGLEEFQRLVAAREVGT